MVEIRLLINDELFVEVVSVQVRAWGSILTRDEERERAVLEIFSREHRPIGTGTVTAALTRAGLLWSEATVGRTLRKLEESWLLGGFGRSGRRLTPAGEARLQELNSRRQHLHHGWELADLLYRSGAGEVLDVLVARRAIERETASLAAAVVTERDLQAIGRVLDRSRQNLKEDTYGPDDDMAFHSAVAAASRNRILESALRLIRQVEWSFPVFLHVRQQAGSSLLVDHEEIFAAIAARDEALAGTRMAAHIEQVMADLQTVVKVEGSADDRRKGPASQRTGREELLRLHRRHSDAPDTLPAHPR